MTTLTATEIARERRVCKADMEQIDHLCTQLRCHAIDAYTAAHNGEWEKFYRECDEVRKYTDALEQEGK